MRQEATNFSRQTPLDTFEMGPMELSTLAIESKLQNVELIINHPSTPWEYLSAWRLAPAHELGFR